MKISVAGKLRIARLLVEKLGRLAKVSSYFFRKARKTAVGEARKARRLTR